MSVGRLITLDEEDEDDEVSRFITSVGLTWRFGDMVDRVVRRSLCWCTFLSETGERSFRILLLGR
jgi:hypothetical protein